MNLLQNRNYKYIAAVAVCLGGLFAASVTMAGGYGGGRGGGGYNDDDGYGGDRDEPRFTDRGDTLRATLEVDDLNRNRNVQVEIEAHAEVTVECVRYSGNYGNRRIRREVEVLVDGDETFSRNRIRGDELDVWVETADLEDRLEDGYDDDDDYYGRRYENRDFCPNNYRLDRVISVMFSDAKIDVDQGNRNIETWLCSFDRDTRNGTIDRDDVECHRL